MDDVRSKKQHVALLAVLLVERQRPFQAQIETMLFDRPVGRMPTAIHREPPSFPHVPVLGLPRDS